MLSPRIYRVRVVSHYPRDSWGIEIRERARKNQRSREETRRGGRRETGLITIRTNHLSRNLVHKHKLNFDAEGERAC